MCECVCECVLCVFKGVYLKVREDWEYQGIVCECDCYMCECILCVFELCVRGIWVLLPRREREREREGEECVALKSTENNRDMRKRMKIQEREWRNTLTQIECDVLSKSEREQRRKKG